MSVVIDPESVAVQTQLVCPKCGGDAITSWEDSSTGYYGVRWFINSEPDDDGTHSVIHDYDGVYDERRAECTEYCNDLYCRGCDLVLTEQDLIPHRAIPDPDWTPATRPKRALGDGPALDQIQHMLRDPEWGVGMLEDIRDIAERTGRSCEDLPDPDDPGEKLATWGRH